MTAIRVGKYTNPYRETGALGARRISSIGPLLGHMTWDNATVTTTPTSIPFNSQFGCVAGDLVLGFFSFTNANANTMTSSLSDFQSANTSNSTYGRFTFSGLLTQSDIDNNAFTLTRSYGGLAHSGRYIFLRGYATPQSPLSTGNTQNVYNPDNQVDNYSDPTGSAGDLIIDVCSQGNTLAQPTHSSGTVLGTQLSTKTVAMALTYAPSAAAFGPRYFTVTPLSNYIFVATTWRLQRA